MRPRTRAELRVFVYQLLAQAGADGLTEPEILHALGDQFAPNTLEPLLADLRSTVGLQATTKGPRRWRLVAHDVDGAPGSPLTLRHLEFLAEHGMDAGLRDVLDQVLGEIDAAVREPASVMASEHARAFGAMLGISTDPRLIARLLLASRRKSLRILYDSPFKDPPEPTWYDVEPWAVHLESRACFLRAYLIAEKNPCTFDVGFITAVEDLDIAPPRAPIPDKPWAGDRSGIGPETFHPGVAVIRVRGEAARSIAEARWHPEQHDRWLEVGELLERTVPYHDRRRITRYLASAADGIVSLDPPELRDALVAFTAHALKLG